MSRLQGQSTLSEAEKQTEAKKYIGLLKPQFESMAQNERDFVRRIDAKLFEFGPNCIISPRELSYLRDLNTKY